MAMEGGSIGCRVRGMGMGMGMGITCMAVFLQNVMYKLRLVSCCTFTLK